MNIIQRTSELDKKLFGNNKLSNYELIPFYKLKIKQHIKYTVPYKGKRICFYGIVHDYFGCENTLTYTIVVKGYDENYPLRLLCTRPESEILFYRKKSKFPRKDWMYFCPKCSSHFKSEEYGLCPKMCYEK